MEYKFYNQLEYPHVPYEYNGNGRSIKTSGCGICSACMVVENMLGIPCSLEEMVQIAYASGARDDSGTEMSLLAKGVCEKFPLTYEMTNDAGTAMQFLQNGEGMIIANSGGDREGWTGVFTSGGHFIVLAAAQGRKITVLDPSVRPDKYDAPGREGKVELDGNIAYTDMQVIAKDCDNRTPSYVLFRKK